MNHGVAIVKKRLALDHSLYTILQILYKMRRSAKALGRQLGE